MLHSLQCLKDTRVLDLLVFYLADRTGTHLDDMARGNVNAFFSFLNANDEIMQNYAINPLTMDLVINHGLICLPESVISHDVAFIVDRKCGYHAADLVRNFYLYYRKRFNMALSKIGFRTDICDKDSKRNQTTIDRGSAVRDDTESCGVFISLFDEFLEENSPGTAMDTVYGRYLREGITLIPEEEFCKPLVPGLYNTFQACRFLSYDPSGKASFNVLQYAHSVFILPTAPYPDSSSLKIFRSCWNLLQEICGPNATYHEYEYHVSAESRNIKRMMDNLTCEWQDMLVRQYIKASENGNIWPTSANARGQPMFLSYGTYTYGSLANSISDLGFCSRTCCKGNISKVRYSISKTYRIVL